MPTASATRQPIPTELPCRRVDADLWFADSSAELEQAKQLCSTCPVRERCLALALQRAEPWGVWGGEILEGGVVVARKRPRGRPRKVPKIVGAAALDRVGATGEPFVSMNRMPPRRLHHRSVVSSGRTAE